MTKFICDFDGSYHALDQIKNFKIFSDEDGTYWIGFALDKHVDMEDYYCFASEFESDMEAQSFLHEFMKNPRDLVCDI